MYPRLFTIGPVTVYSFGLMMGIGFFVASLLLHKETVRKNMVGDFSLELVMFLRGTYIAILSTLVISYFLEHGFSGFSSALEHNPTPILLIIAGTILFGSLVFRKSYQWANADTSAFIVVVSIIIGICGSKLLYVLENFSDILRAPFDMIFSPGGLTWYGGFILTTAIIYYFMRKKHIPFFRVCDAASPALMIGYGIARIGCHLAGDGDYGMPTNLPWATNYENGTYPPSIAFRDFPEIVQKYGVNGVVPDSIPVHPAPVYEFLAGLILFFVLWKFRTTIRRDGQLFMLYLVLAGIARFTVEIIRLNPRIMFGLSEAQLFSGIMIIAGLIGFFRLKSIPHVHVVTTS